MDRLTLAHIDDSLDSTEVASLCFLCQDVIKKKRLEGIKDAKDLFLRLEERGLLENSAFLSQLLYTIRRADLLNLLETDSRRPEETDSTPALSSYRVMLYNIYEDMTRENLDTLKFLLGSKLDRRQIDESNTALDLFVKMEKAGFLSSTNLNTLHAKLQMLDQPLAMAVQRHIDGVNHQRQPRSLPHVSMDSQRLNKPSQPTQTVMTVPENQPSYGVSLHSDAEPMQKSASLPDETDYYSLDHNPRGLCVVINNEKFSALNERRGTQEDAKALQSVFTRLGFRVVIHDNLTSANMRSTLEELGKRNFMDDDALVVCVLSHGEQGSIFGTDAQPVLLSELKAPFTSRRSSTLVGKPKLFFIQACQGGGYQGGALPCPPQPREEEKVKQSLETDAGPVHGETVPWEADFLLGMATVQECKSFRSITTGSIFIQELCRQLKVSAESSEKDDILTVLTRVNRNVSKGLYLNHKQMPEPKYTLTKKLVLKYV